MEDESMADPLNPLDPVDPPGSPNPFPDPESRPDPLDPHVPPDPLSAGPDPLHDPMLSALSRSIENPPEFHDPLAIPEPDHERTSPDLDDFMDDLGAMLGALEDSIEGTEERQPALPTEDPVPPEQPEASSEVAYGSFDSSPPLPPEPDGGGGSPGLLPAQPLRGGAGGRASRRLPLLRRPPRMRTGGGLRSKAASTRCPMTHQKVTVLCDCCREYGFWPEGPEKAPGQCWHDWLMNQAERHEDDENGFDDGARS